MNSLLLDTSFVLALEIASDQYHKRAMSCRRTLSILPIRLVTTSYVLCETVTFLQSRGHHEKAVQIGNWLMQSHDVEFVHVDDDLFGDAWHYLATHRDKTYSLPDCVSFVLMARLGIRTALTFDHHFVQAGFETMPLC